MVRTLQKPQDSFGMNEFRAAVGPGRFGTAGSGRPTVCLVGMAVPSLQTKASQHVTLPVGGGVRVLR